MPIKSFRGLIRDEEEEKINLHTTDGTIGYRIVKFQCMQDGFGNSEMVIKIYKVPRTANKPVDNVIDFSDNALLGACMISGSITSEADPEDRVIIFDSEVFNQDIFITAATSTTADPTNYYIELEQVKLDLNENTVATLKDIRNIAAQ